MSHEIIPWSDVILAAPVGHVTRGNPQAFRFGNRADRCSFNRYGNGSNGHDVACNDETQGYACDIRNADPGSTSADQLLAGEIEVCAPVWPMDRTAALAPFRALRAADRTYDRALRAANQVRAPQVNGLCTVAIGATDLEELLDYARFYRRNARRAWSRHLLANRS